MTTTGAPYKATAKAMKLKFPSFGTVDDTVVGFALEEAYAIIESVNTTLKLKDLCAMYLAAHFLAVDSATAGSDGREVTSETIGKISVTYKTGSGSHDGPYPGDLGTTAYGARYLQLKNLGNPRFKMVGGDTQPHRRGLFW